MQELSDLWVFITAWYNLPFSLALLVFLGLSALQFIGLDQDHEADVDADADVDLDHHVDLDHDADLDHDLGQDVAELPAWASALEFLGVGHAPVTMILLVLVGSFGLLGWIANWFLLGVFPVYQGWMVLAVLLGVLLLSIWLTSHTARLIGQTIPSFASTATSASQLVARRGHVTSAQVDETYGQVKVRDPGGTLITVFAKVDRGKPTIPRNTEVYLVDYDAAKKIYTVVPSD